MMNSLKLEKDKKGEGNIKDAKNIFRLKKEVNNNTINSINIFLDREKKMKQLKIE